MASKKRRKFRLPVISRLTLAWCAAMLLTVVIIAVAAGPSFLGEKQERVSLAFDGLEFIARPARQSLIEPGLRLAAPGDTGFDPKDWSDKPDIDVFEDEDPLPAAANPEFDPDDVIITIAGETGATPVTAASLTPIRRARPVPDPQPGMQRRSTYGDIPTVDAAGRRAADVYRAGYISANGQPQVAMILGGLGINKELTERAIDELPAEISLAFAPYSKDLEFWTSKARAAGHEVLIELPMEGYSGNSSKLGPAALLTGRAAEENLKRLDWLMSRFGGYFAATNYLGGKFAADRAALTPILKGLEKAGVGFIDDTGAAAALTPQTGAAIASVSRIVPPAPNDAARDDVRRALKAVNQSATRDRITLAKTYAYAATIDELVHWSEMLEDEGIQLTPASATLP